MFNRDVQLPDNELHGKQHTQSHLPFNDRNGGNDRHNQVLGLADKYPARLLELLQAQRPHLDVKKLLLQRLPFPGAPSLAALQLYLLHESKELVYLVVAGRLFLENHIVKQLAFMQETHGPQAVADTSRQKDKEQEAVI